MSTFERLQRFLEQRLAIDARDVALDTPLESLGLDSLARLELLFDLEEEFGIRLSHNDQGARTVGEVTAAIERALGSAPPKRKPIPIRPMAAVACAAVLLQMLSGTPARAQHLHPDLDQGRIDASTHSAVPVERLLVTPPPEDLAPAPKGRWQRFEETLRARSDRRSRWTEMRLNDGTRMACYEPALLSGCYLRSPGGFVMTRGFGR